MVNIVSMGCFNSYFSYQSQEAGYSCFSEKVQEVCFKYILDFDNELCFYKLYDGFILFTRCRSENMYNSPAVL